jgi:hypothetical protein
MAKNVGRLLDILGARLAMFWCVISFSACRRLAKVNKRGCCEDIICMYIRILIYTSRRSVRRSECARAVGTQPEYIVTWA